MIRSLWFVVGVLAALSVSCKGEESPLPDIGAGRTTAELFAQAAEHLHAASSVVEDDMRRVFEDRWRGGQPRLDAHLESNREAIDLFLAATSSERTYAEDLRLEEPSVPGDDPFLGFRQKIALVDLALLDAHRLANRGQRAESMARVLACLRFSVQQYRAENATMATAASSWHVTSHGLEQMLQLLHDARFEQGTLRETLDEMQRMRAVWPGLDVVYRVDRRAMRELCERSFTGEGIDEEAVRAAIERYEELDAEYTELYTRAYRERDASIFGDPALELEAELQDLDGQAETPEAATDVAAKLILYVGLPKVSSTFDLDYVARVQFDLVMVGLAERLYFAEHDEHADPLDVLVPDYLHELPEDPFDDGRPVKLHRSSGHWVPYSVGPDRIDQGGDVAWRRADFHEGGDILSAARYHGPHQ